MITKSGNRDKSRNVNGGLKGKSTSGKYPWPVMLHHSKTEMSEYLILSIYCVTKSAMSNNGLVERRCIKRERRE